MLEQLSSSDWSATRRSILPSCHEVDRNALVIWCHFHPLPLAEAFATTDDASALTQKLRLRGEFGLASQCDSSHWFLYGHRYWPQVKQVVLAWATKDASSIGDLEPTVRALGATVATAAGTRAELTLAITFVGVMTLRQIGIEAFRTGSTSEPSSPTLSGSPDEIVARRQKDDGQGAFGFLRGPNTRFSVVFDERRRDGRFPLINHQHLTTAAALDTRDYKTTTGARSSHEGPIPCDCRSASCGTCWVGILGGAEKLSEVEPLEQRRLIEFGYWPTPDDKPIIRLACMAKATGNVTLVIPSWHGRIGVAGLGTTE